MIYQDYLDTPIGVLAIRANEKAVINVCFIESCSQTVNGNAVTQACKLQLKEYFDGTRKTFHLCLENTGTQFQTQVWNALSSIPFGQVASYQDIAIKINNPNAVRAVGTANGKNPHTIIVPCHRVIGSNGTLTGYAGGLNRKQWLLAHEARWFSH